MSLPLSVALQYLLPKTALTRFAGWCAHSRATWWTRRVIPWFIRRYGVDMDEAANPDPRGYATFNEFFTRQLRPGVRPLAPEGFVCPVDGAISQFGDIREDQIFQAKGHRYSTRALVGGSAGLAAQFREGSFATIYLSPKDYHRIHMPSEGRLRKMFYVPGELFSVNPLTAAHVPGLFARNERVVCRFDTAAGPVALVLVGALNVGSIETVWAGEVAPGSTRATRSWYYTSGEVRLARGAEMGRFNMGSTVILVGPPGGLMLDPLLVPDQTVRMGQAIGMAAAQPTDST